MKPYHAEDPAPPTLSDNLNFPGSPPGLSVIYNVTGASLLECDSIANVPATTVDHVVENVVGRLNLIWTLRVDDEIVESRRSARARASRKRLGFASERMRIFTLKDRAFITRAAQSSKI